ncbi:phosphoglycerate dehydrogenase-like enzyme [Propionibacteriaceae bacterium ES.041]|uniref:D-2-hydroxyacid dehydrogenase n=1 Tax=Enemella evansiae TaxID=2016499 RepID=UPI000B96CB47|nr:D-2-hydroxyacid dehydrogenase [Enemella evansiae]OYO02312.1 hypothetical protein CGZ96_02940 [Enemella evansiae]PFG67026.1 phosphoglycerate dehydrogenase-like enzyme [Propionibacteriaceae bacterium ES.041]
MSPESTDDQLVIALPQDPAGLERLRGIAQHTRIVLLEPGALTVPAELAGTVTGFCGDSVPSNLSELPRLRWIQLASAGFRQAIGAGVADTVAVTNASGVNDIPIAEWCAMMMLALRRDLPGTFADQQAHRWDRSPVHQAELRGLRVGILGFGNIGQQVARTVRALGLEVWVASRSAPGFRPDRYDPLDRGPEEVPIPDRSFGLDRLPDFLSGLDFLVITVPATPTTDGLINDAAFRALPPTAYLLNPARASVVDERALRSALAEGRLAGAALDVHYRSPMAADDPTWELPRVIITSHVSGSSDSTFFLPRLWDLLARNTERLLAGRPLLNRIAPADLAG